MEIKIEICADDVIASSADVRRNSGDQIGDQSMDMLLMAMGLQFR